MTLSQTTRDTLNYNDNSPNFSDFYRLFNRLFSRNDALRRSVMITSATEGEGKTTISAFLALTGALSTSEHCLIIDADLRRPGLHKRFGMARKNGLSEILLDEKNLTDVIRRTPYRNLHLITAGVPVDKPFQLIRLNETKQLIQRLTQYYKLIVIDGPPIIPVSDATRIAQIVDAVILVVKTGKTHRDVVKRALEHLRESGARFLGIVLNDSKEVLPYYYQYKYYKNYYRKIA